MKKICIAALLGISLANLGVCLSHLEQKPLMASADNEPRVISSDAEFIAFKADLSSDEMIGKSIRLDADINYEITGSFTAESECAFRGSFDGNGHSITITVTGSSCKNIGVFRCIGSQGSVSNLTVNGKITGSDHIGSIASQNYGLIENCINKASITATGQYVGGLVGVMNGSDHESNTARIINCENHGDVISKCTQSACLGAGGLVGYSYGNAMIVDSSNYGDVSCGTAPYGLGGVLGVIRASEKAEGDIYLTNCYNGGTVKGDRYVGGILGHVDAKSNKNKKIHLTGCLNAGNIICSSTSKGYDGQLIGNGRDSSSFTIENSAIMGSMSANVTSYVGNIVGCPKKNTLSGVYIASTSGVSDNVKKVIKLVRTFDCDADNAFKASLNDAVNDLTEEEVTLLSGVTYWDKSEEADKDYISAAYYIIGYTYNTMFAHPVTIISDGKSMLFLIVLSVMVLSGSITFLLVRKNKAN